MSEESPDKDEQFVALLTSHQSALRLYVLSLLPGDPAADDVTQQANATVWRKREGFAIGTNFKAWIFSIARYEVLNYRKKQARDSRLVFSEELQDVMAEEIPALADDMKERQAALRSCLNGLKPSDRELIQNRYFDRTPLQEYAEKIGRSAGGLKVTLHRLRNRLQTCIETKIKMKEAGI